MVAPLFLLTLTGKFCNIWGKGVGRMAENFSVADEILKLKKLLDDGIITQEEFDAKKKELLSGDFQEKEPDKQSPPPVITISPGPTPSPPKKKGMNGCLFAFVLTASIILGISLLSSIISAIVAVSSTADYSPTSTQSEEIKILFDASGLGGKTVEELKEALPEVEDSGTVDIPMANGETINTNYYWYYKDGLSIGFVSIDNLIVSANFMWDEDQSYSGDKTEIINLLGITPGKELEETGDTNYAIRWERVSPGISEVWVSVMDSDAKTFSNVKVVYDSAVSGRMPDDPERPDLEVLSYDSTSDGYTGYIIGKIRNNTDKTYSYVQVEIGLYKGESLVGSTLDNVNNLGPGETWEFKAIVLEDDCDTYRITNVTGF